MTQKWRKPKAGNARHMPKSEHMRRLVRALRPTAVAIVALAAIFALATAGISAFTILSTRDKVHSIAGIAENEQADAIVVLGASVFADGTPSDILADRLEVASDLYFSGAAPTIIASGDSTTAHYNEPYAMKKYCEELGVPPDSILEDREGYDTYASVYRAKFVYGADSIIVVTQAYHLYRALMIAELLGIQAQGVAADKGEYTNQINYSVRELFARDKDFMEALLKIPPRM